ncbi:hypothetical protein [Streptomyces bicolor]|uniref:hypothetical protein n=1 Tax=Streptomyces bicolor TaxID=66874 RepID=UPI000ACE875E|nr:hypothetical protein [Streptomyces bicolor]
MPLIFYALVAWLPQIMQASGHPRGEAGLMMSVMRAIGIPLGSSSPSPPPVFAAGGSS